MKATGGKSLDCFGVYLVIAAVGSSSGPRLRMQLRAKVSTVFFLSAFLSFVSVGLHEGHFNWLVIF